MLKIVFARNYVKKKTNLNLTYQAGKVEAPWHLTKDTCTVRTKRYIILSPVDIPWLKPGKEIDRAPSRYVTRGLSLKGLVFTSPSTRSLSLHQASQWHSFSEPFLEEGAGNAAKSHIFQLKKWIPGAFVHCCQGWLMPLSQLTRSPMLGL